MTLRLPSNDLKWRRSPRSPVGSRARYRHSGAIQDALDGILSTILRAENGPPTLSHLHFALLDRHPGSTPPNQPPLPPNAHFGPAQREFFLDVCAPSYACITRTEYLRRFRVIAPRRKPTLGTRVAMCCGGLGKLARIRLRTWCISSDFWTTWDRLNSLSR